MPNRRASLSRLGSLIVGVIAVVLAPMPAHGEEAPARPDLVRIVRLKISAADLASAEAWTEDYRRDYGADAVWLDARGWLARGAWLMRDYDRALAFAHEVRSAIGEPKPEELVPLGAALEVEGQIMAERQGKAASVRFFQDAEKLSKDVAFRARMWKNVNRLELVGRKAPELKVDTFVGGKPAALAELRGKPVLLFFWFYRCSDCKAAAPTLAALHERFAGRGLVIVAPTRLYGLKADGSNATAEEEKSDVTAALKTTFPGLPDLAVPIDEEGMIRYGASATPTFVLIDREGIVRFYTPTRPTTSTLAALIEPLVEK